MSARPIIMALATVLAVLGVLAGPAAAHPLGNFSINHQTRVAISSDRVDLRYILDQAEIPTFQERGRSQADLLAAKQAEALRGLTLRIDGRPARLASQPGARISFPQGQGGLRTTRVELAFTALLSARPRRVEVSDESFPGRVGWKAVIVAPGSGTAVRSSAPQGDPTAGLRRYPASLLESPENRRSASFTVQPGAGTVAAPGARTRESTSQGRSGDALTRAFEDAAAGKGAFLVLLLIAFGWGALHALSPGHGKAMVAAYLVGTRGTSRDALVLGLTVTVTHTIGVFALGVVTLGLSAYVLPEDLYPWLNLASGLLVLGVGASVLRSRLRRRRAERAPVGVAAAEHDHVHAHQRVLVGVAAGEHDHVHDHNDDHVHDHHHKRSHGYGADRDHGHPHGGGHHHHHVPERVTPKTLIVMGVSAGLLPCPSALVVLLAAIAQHQIGLGLVLILAFSAGLAATLTVLGLAVVHAGRAMSRFDTTSPIFTLLPALSAVLIVCVGLGLTIQALPSL